MNPQNSQNLVIVKCPNPNCGLQLSFKAVPNYREKPISCPRCHHSGIVKDFIFIKVPGAAEQSNETQMTTAYIRCIETGEEYPLKPGATTIGRRAHSASANVTFNDPEMFMSRLHATITIVNTGDSRQFHLRDEKSANGTIIDGQTLPPGSIVKLAPGKEFKMGKLTFVCRFDDDSTRIVKKKNADDGKTTMV